ncbi:MAG TPA: hypothetical protein VGM19_12395 [Armatimonadota bacterium]|jgi:hypothetical protein
MSEESCSTPPAAGVRPWDLELQRQRGAELMGLVRPCARRFFNEEGVCVVSEQNDADVDRGHVPEVPFYLRERVNSVMALMAGSAEDVEFGNRILSNVELTSCSFTTMNLIEMLLRYADRVWPEHQARIRDHIATELVQVQRPYCSYVGANDNFPSMDTFIMLAGGELLNDDFSIQSGLDNLWSCRDLLARRGFLSEYNSPTYGGVTLHGLDEIVNSVRNEEARELARAASERMWLDLACHWHPALSFQIGPYSRAYHGNSIAWSSLTAQVVWVALGDVVFVSPRTIYEDHPLCYERRANNLEFCQAGNGGYAGTVHQFPDYIGEMFLAKRYPFRVQGTTEAGTFHYGDYRRTPEGACVHVPGAAADYGADSAVLTSYLEEGFGLGTATRGFLGGMQSDIFHVLYRHHAPATRWEDLRTAFTRYLVNESQPEDAENIGVLAQQGNGMAVQDDRRALALFSPNGVHKEGVHSLKLSLILQELSSSIEEIWIGDRRLENGDGESLEPDWVILRDGPMLLAFYPLATTDLGRKACIRSASENGYRVISFYNYEGPARDFAMHDLQIIQNDFVFEAATLEDYPDVPSFLADLRRAQLSDTTVLEARRVRYLREGRELFFWVDPGEQTIKAAVVNGKQLPCTPLAVTDLDVARVPWLNETGIMHEDLGWWDRIAARPGLPGLEGLSGRRVD